MKEKEVCALPAEALASVYLVQNEMQCRDCNDWEGHLSMGFQGVVFRQEREEIVVAVDRDVRVFKLIE